MEQQHVDIIAQPSYRELKHIDLHTFNTCTILWMRYESRKLIYHKICFPFNRKLIFTILEVAFLILQGVHIFAVNIFRLVYNIHLITTVAAFIFLKNRPIIHIFV